MKNPPNRKGHKIVVADEPVVVVRIIHERGRDVAVGSNGVRWVTA